MNKYGLIMEGGAMRGMFTAGVMDVLMENEIHFDGGIGVSAGAAFGCNYKSNQIGRVIRYNKKYCKDPRYCSIRSLIKTGDLYGAEFCYSTISYELDIFDSDAYFKNPMEFYVVCTDVETGKPVYRNCITGLEEDLTWIRASASMPIASKVVEATDYKLLDGGISDSIPLKYFESLGYNKNVIILTQPKGYIKKPSKALPLIKTSLKDYPNVYKTMQNRHNDYNETISFIEEKEKSGDVLVIRPPEKLPVGRVEHNPDKLQIAYDIGVKTALEQLEEIKNFITK
jgi:predicted patatin/cPLA2 family phospholipase